MCEVFSRENGDALYRTFVMRRETATEVVNEQILHMLVILHRKIDVGNNF